MNSFEYIVQFPYASPIYYSLGTLKNEYRIYKIKNFLLFYTINKEKNIITIARVLYQKRDIVSILN